MPVALKYLSDQTQLKENVTSVLAKWKGDGKYYVVQVIQCDSKAKKCLVKFEDQYQCSMETKDLHCQLALDRIQDDQIVCCVCDSGVSKAPNEIIMCDSCQQGYHINCHDPKIDREEARLDDEEVEWFCHTCKEVAKLAAKVTKQTAKVTKLAAKVTKLADKVPNDAVKQEIVQEAESTTAPAAASETSTEAATGEPLICAEEVLPDGGIVEQMDPIVIKAAKALAEKGDNIKTKDFVELIATQKDTPSAGSKAPAKRAKKAASGCAPRKAAKTAAKTAAKPAAAAY